MTDYYDIGKIFGIYLIANLVVIYIEYKSWFWLDKKLNIRLFGIYIILIALCIITFLIFSFVQNYNGMKSIISMLPQYEFDMLGLNEDIDWEYYMSAERDLLSTFRAKAILSLASLPFFISVCTIGFMLFKRRILREKETRDL